MLKVLLLGSTGFVGRHIQEALVDAVSLYVTNREPQENVSGLIYFDFLVPKSWKSIVELKPDIIINSAGYGVVKDQNDLELTYDINYRMPSRLITMLQGAGLTSFWLQIGTAFEYNLDKQALDEESTCVPMTHYGISKYLLSNFLLSQDNKCSFLVLRPFAMFGPYESDSKLLPYLISSQRDKRKIALSTGEQKRDYFFVKDLASFIKEIINRGITNIGYDVLNIGSSEATSLKDLALELSKYIPDFEALLWQWGEVPQRPNENQLFYNCSTKALKFGLNLTPLEVAFQETVSYYFDIVK
jgi:nucleoside-diphosphate-sugar epimerase